MKTFTFSHHIPLSFALITSMLVFSLVQPGDAATPSDDAVRGIISSMVQIPGKNYRISSTEVTRAQWKAIMGKLSEHRGMKLEASTVNKPMVCISWEDCQVFIATLNALPAVKEAGLTFRLPTADEWEYACRAGTTGKYSKMEGGRDVKAENLGDVAWFVGNSWKMVTNAEGKEERQEITEQPVATKKPNAFGLYDMHGNVWEWTDTISEDGKDRTFCGGHYDASAASLKHPGIVQIHDAVFNGDVYCFVMELVRGYTVAQLAAQRGKLDETSLLDIAAAVASALGYAWRQHGVIHCDIKPDNVMVDSDGTIKILDLGLAKTSKALRGKNADDMVYGTPQYISPEQARGQNDLDCRTDIYSLGATLYYLATGSVLFPGVGDVEAMECQINGKAPNPHSQNAGLSIGFCSLLEKMLAKDRSKRQTDWDVVLNDIAAVRAGLPIQSGPPFPNCSTIVSGPSLSFFRSGRPPSGRLVRCPKQMQTQIPAKSPERQTLRRLNVSYQFGRL